MKKKIVSLALVASLLALVIVGGTLAYFTDTEDATNTFTVGNVDIVLDEGGWTDKITVAPNVNYDKEPVVYNVGDNEAWIRVDVTLSDYNAFKAAADANDIDDLWSMFTDVNNNTAKWTRLADITDTDDKGTITFRFYYNTLLAAGTNTGALFTDFEIPAAFDNDEMAAIADPNGKFTIDIVAYAIQDADNYDSAADAFVAYDDQVTGGGDMNATNDIVALP